ncbi:MAG: NAD(P)-dependent oxidoreductase [Alphaproteobacteria bacterium]|nr:NAD(P)-dependent oxidoreductase [Alphaproteobacteria bacterium]
MTSISDDAPILVVGGRGFVGAAVVRHLARRGRRLHLFGPAAAGALPDGVDETAGSITDAAALAAILGRLRPRCVVSFAAFSSGTVGLSRSGEIDPEQALAVNVLGFRRLLAAAVDAGVRRVIWSSSTVVLGAAQDLVHRLDESAPRRPLTNYGLTKLLAEDVAAFMRRRHDLETIGLRIPLMLGPGLWYDGAAAVVKRMVAAARTRTRPRVEVPGVPFDAMHVDDAGALVERLVGHDGPLAALYNVAGFTTDHATIRSRLAALVPGFDADLATTPPPIVYPLVSQAALERDTGWRHRHDLDAVLRDMLAEGSSPS